MLQILYKKKTETTYNVKFKPALIHPRFTLPIDLTDTWNGKNIIVQSTTFDSYYVEFAANNDELNNVTDIMTADNIIIRDNVQNIEYTADKSVQESFIFNEPEPIPVGNSWKVSFIFKTNRQVISKALPNSNTHTLSMTYDDGLAPVNKTYYTDFEVFEDTRDTEQESSINQNGVNVLDYALTQRIIRAVFYLDPDDASDLKEWFEKSQTMTIDGVTILENSIATSEPYGEDLYKVQLECLISSEVSFPSVV